MSSELGTLKPLKVNTVRRLLGEVETDDRAKLIADLDDAGVDPDGRLEALERWRGKQGLLSTLIRSAYTVDGAARIIQAAIEDSGNGQKIEDLECEGEELHFLALRLCGFNPEKMIEQATKEVDEDADPTQPESGG